MAGTENLTVERVDSTMVVTMNRPEAKNALSPPMLVGMADAWVEADTDDSIRSLVLTGAGGDFCTGMDLKAFSTGGGGSRDPVIDERMKLTTGQLTLLLEGIDWRRTVPVEVEYRPALA